MPVVPIACRMLVDVSILVGDGYKPGGPKLELVGGGGRSDGGVVIMS
jgi:hypothetical protein